METSSARCERFPSRYNVGAACWLVIALSFSWLETAHGTEKIIPLNFKRLSIDNGLPDHTANQFIQDQSGLVWIATDNGLFSYDGHQSINYQHSIHQADSLTHNSVNTVFQDSSGAIWAGTKGGLNSLFSNRQGFKHYRHQQDEPTSLIDDHIKCLYEGQNDRLWVGTANGLCVLNRENNQFRVYETSDKPESIHFILEDRDARIWIGTQSGLKWFDRDGHSFIAVDLSFSSKKDTVPAFSAYQGKSGNLWVGTQYGLISVDQNGSLIRSYANNRQIENTAPLGISSIIEDNAGLLWLGSSQCGLSLFDRKSEQFKPYQYVPGDPHSLASNMVRSLFKDASDLIWVGTQADGVYQWNPSNSEGAWSKLPWALVLSLLFLVSFGLLTWRYRTQRDKAVQDLLLSEDKLKNALWGTGNEFWDCNLQTGVVTRSNMLEIWGDGHQNMTLENVFNGMHPDDRSNAREALQKHLDGETPYYESQYRQKSKHGDWVWVLDCGRVVERDSNERPLRLAGTNKNVSDLKRAEEKLKLIAKAFQNTSDAVVITDSDFKILTINPAYTRITGYPAKDAQGSDFKISGKNEEDYHQNDLVREALAATGHWQGELWQQHKMGGRFPVSVNLDAVVNDHGQITHYVCVSTDITFVKKAEEKLRHLANYDQLTSLPNRNLFQDRLAHALSLAHREHHKVALLFLDLDRFKNINDSLGHAVGDLLLQTVAQRVKECLREVDSIARLGGDEFTVILEGVNSLPDIAAVAEKVLRSMGASFSLSGHEMVITPSIGISVFPEDGEDAETLLKCADTAMYHAKHEGRNNFQFFTPEMNREVVERLHMENEIRHALERNEFVVYYQPKFDTKIGKICGLEALVRWQHPTEGMVSPVKFIPVAEETGLIVPLGLWVLQQACADASTWLESGLNGCKVAVNLSALQFKQENLSDHVATALADSGLPPEFLEFEITESTLLDNIDHALSVLQEFRSLGLTLALDDFGTGFSSLGYLKRLPIQTLKIDKSFIRDVTQDPEDASIVSTIIDLAHNLNISVVAEGVEREDQLLFLKQKGCEVVQGYLFAKPMSFEDATRLLSVHEFFGADAST